MTPQGGIYTGGGKQGLRARGFRKQPRHVGAVREALDRDSGPCNRCVLMDALHKHRKWGQPITANQRVLDGFEPAFELKRQVCLHCRTWARTNTHTQPAGMSQCTQTSTIYMLGLTTQFILKDQGGLRTTGFAEGDKRRETKAVPPRRTAAVPGNTALDCVKRGPPLKRKAQGLYLSSRGGGVVIRNLGPL